MGPQITRLQHSLDLRKAVSEKSESQADVGQSEEATEAVEAVVANLRQQRDSGKSEVQLYQARCAALTRVQKKLEQQRLCVEIQDNAHAGLEAQMALLKADLSAAATTRDELESKWKR